MDTSQRGKINIDELKIGLQKLGHAIPQDDLQILMDAVSFDLPLLFNTGFVNLKQFTELSMAFLFCREISIEMDIWTVTSLLPYRYT